MIAGVGVQAEGFGVAGAGFQDDATGARAAGVLLEPLEDRASEAPSPVIGAMYMRLISNVSGAHCRQPPQATGRCFT